MAEDLTIDPTGLHVFGWIAVIGSILLWLPTVIQGATSTKIDSAQRVGVVAVTIVFTAGFAFFFWRFTRLRATFGSETITIVGLIRTTTLPRADFWYLATSSGGSWIFLITKSGRRVPVTALGGARWKTRDRLADLNQRLKADPPSPSSG